MLLEAIYELNKQDPEKSEILIRGYGRLTLDQAKEAATKRLREAVDLIQNKDDPMAWKNAKHLIYDNGVVDAMLKAIVEANQEIEDMQGKDGV